MFNDAEKGEENALRKISDEKNYNIENNENVNLNENINYNWNKNEGIKNICKKIDFNNEEKNDKNVFIFESAALISDIMKVHQNSKKFNYNIQTINTDFNDFINLCSIVNDENKNVENIQNENFIPFQGYSQINQLNSNAIYNKPIQKFYSNSRDKYIIFANGQKQLNKDSLVCTCKNSFCLKFYCECFSNGKCCENCGCVNCKNTPEFEPLRQEKYKSIIERNPRAIYQINSVKKSFTCNCKNSNCQKKYCDCFQNGKSCTSKCKCLNCYNKVINSKNNNNNNNNGRRKKMRRIKVVKTTKINKNNEDIYFTPKRKRRKNYNSGDKSTAAITEANHHTISNDKNLVFNTASNKNKFKEIRQRLNMEISKQK